MLGIQSVLDMPSVLNIQSVLDIQSVLNIQSVLATRLILLIAETHEVTSKPGPCRACCPLQGARVQANPLSNYDWQLVMRFSLKQYSAVAVGQSAKPLT